MGDDRKKEVNAMTSNGTASSWEPLELRLVGRVDEVILGGLNHPCTGHLPPGKTVPAEVIRASPASSHLATSLINCRSGSGEEPPRVGVRNSFR